MQIVRPAFTYEDASSLKSLLLCHLSGEFDYSEGERAAFRQDEQRYMTLRRRLRNDPIVAVFMPEMVKRCHDLEHALDSIRAMNGGLSEWRNLVRSIFVPLLDRLDEEASPPPQTHSVPHGPMSSLIDNGLVAEGHALVADSVGNALSDEEDRSPSTVRRLTGAFMSGLENGLRGTPASDLDGSQDAPAIGSLAVNTSEWTGVLTGPQQLKIVRSLIPSAMTAIDALIFELEQRGGNNGPPIEDRDEALAVLRSLHVALGTILTLADQGSLESGHGLGLIGEAVGYANRALALLRDNSLQCGVVTMTAAMAALCSDVSGIGPASAAVGALAALVPAKARP